MLLINEDFIATERIGSFCKNDVEVFTLRTDKIHPVVSGNKWFKLKLYIQEALEKGHKTIVTAGGAYSNHIVATAFACMHHRLKSVGFIRGEMPASLSHTLIHAKNYGMELHFMSRKDYKDQAFPPGFDSAGNYFIREGGYGAIGAAGMATLKYDHAAFTHVCCAVGTGTMMAGLINSKNPTTKLSGISVLKNNYQLKEDVLNLLEDKSHPVDIVHDYHFGGYAKYSPQLINFMNHLYFETGIPTDFVYSGKLFYAVNDLIEKDHFNSGSKILIIHCGGLQGNLSLPKGTLIF